MVEKVKMTLKSLIDGEIEFVCLSVCSLGDVKESSIRDKNKNLYLK